ncbi:winged helix-turn-helix transcriptional regulator [Nonomuraea sp. JJY05]|uniref:winged helix-turn-helix transcriptional regulator n=1 Tax=Nonomuraea sp. JJY05 TaxID=3350255 RepID=UPI00373ED73E
MTPTWAGTYRAVRANTEGINGRLKGFDLDLGEAKNRPAHGRVAQTLLIALIVTVANDRFLDAWRHTHQANPAPSDTTTKLDDQDAADPPIPTGKPPPGPQATTGTSARSIPPAAGFAMPSGAILVLLQRPESTRAFRSTNRTTPKTPERDSEPDLIRLFDLVHREVYHQVPPKVEYSLTDFGQSLNTALIPLGDWGEKHMRAIKALPRG